MTPSIKGGGRAPADLATLREILHATDDRPAGGRTEGRAVRLASAVTVLAMGCVLNGPMLARGSDAVLGLLAGTGAFL